jgi:hypothetical protein
VDGHVRVYHGSGTLLPRRYVSRQRLCLRGTTDYWINDALGRPFFVVSKTVTDGLAATLLEEIVPELLAGVPGQPSAAQLDADPLLHRFVVIFDREGSSHSLFSKLWKERIGAITYRKAVKDLWPENQFSEIQVPVPGGGATPMKLASRSTVLSAGDASIPVLEIRRLLEKHSLPDLRAAVEKALAVGAVTRDGIAQFLFSREDWRCTMFSLDGHPHLRTVRIAPPDLQSYRELMGGVR